MKKSARIEISLSSKILTLPALAFIHGVAYIHYRVTLGGVSCENILKDEYGENYESIYM